MAKTVALGIGGHEVDKEEIAVTTGTVRAYKGLLRGVIHPAVELIGRNVSIGDLTAEQSLGSEGAGFGVILFFDALYMNLIYIPVEGVASGDHVRVGFVLGAKERTAVEDGVVVGAEGFAHFLKELGTGGVAPVVSQAGEEPGAGSGQRELKLIFAYGLYSYVVPVGFGAAFKGHVVIFCADHVEQKVSGTGGVGGIKYPLGGGYPVLGLQQCCS